MPSNVEIAKDTIEQFKKSKNIWHWQKRKEQKNQNKLELPNTNN